MTVAIRVGLRGGDGRRRRARDARDPGARCRARRGARPPRPARTPGRSSWPACSRPGVSQILFTLSVREVGASRTSVTVGAAPLVARRDRVHLSRRAGAACRSSSGRSRSSPAGSLLAAERDRPEHLRARGLVFAPARRCSSRCATTSSARSTPMANPETAAAATIARRHARRGALRRASSRRGASCAGCARRAALRALATSASSRRTSRAASRSSRRSSRPSRSGASGSRRCSSAQRAAWGGGSRSGAVLVVAGGVLIGVSADSRRCRRI